MSPVNVYSAAYFEDAWEKVLKPWLETPWVNHIRRAILVPDGSVLNSIQHFVIKHGLMFCDVRVFTPGEIRVFLRDRLLPNQGNLAFSEDLEFIYSCLRYKSVDSLAKSDSLELNSGARDIGNQLLSQEPHLWLMAYDLVKQSGLSILQIRHPELREKLERFNSLLKHVKLGHSYGNDFQMLQSLFAVAESSGFGNFFWDDVLIYGFGPWNIDLWPLIRCVVGCAKKLEVCLLNDLSTPGFAEEVWRGTFEQYLNLVDVIPESPKPLQKLVEFMEHGVVTESFQGDSLPMTCLTISEDPARYVVDQVRSLHKNCERLGIVFSSVNSDCYAGIAKELALQEIYHCDSIGHRSPDSVHQDYVFRLWLDFQKKVSWSAFVEFIYQYLLWSNKEVTSLLELKERKRRAYFFSLTDDFEVIKNALKELTEEQELFFKDWLLLPTQGTVNFFSEQILPVLTQLGFADEWPRITEKVDTFSQLLQNTLITKEHFLSWLEQAVRKFAYKKGEFGRAYQAKVQLVTMNQAVTQYWSHLILVDVSAQSWLNQPPQVSFIERQELESINKSAVIEGNQGAGHLTLKENRGYCLSPQEQAMLQYRQFLHLMTLPQQHLYAIYVEHKSGLQDSQPSDDSLINQIATAGGVPVQRIESTCVHSDSASYSSQEFLSVKDAYDTRHNNTTFFGQYEYSLIEEFDSSNPDDWQDSSNVEKLAFSCKTWERLIKEPEVVWYENVLGVSQWDNFLSSKKLILGTLVHRWLSFEASQSSWVSLPTLEDWQRKIKERAVKDKFFVKSIYENSTRTAFHPWDMIWKEALGVAFRLAERVIDLVQNEENFLWKIRTEYSFSGQIQWDADCCVHSSGRIDLMLIGENQDSSQKLLYILDFKTSGDQSLNVKRMFSTGEGLQLLLYGLFIEQEILKKEGFLVEIRLATVNLDEPVDANLKLITCLREEFSVIKKRIYLAKKGCLGQKDTHESDFAGKWRFPLATISIVESILEEKWAKISKINLLN
jgi:hypothetical protein